MRFSAARPSRSWSRRRRSSAFVRPFGPLARSVSTSRTNAPISRPSSTGRPTASPCQNGSLPGMPGAGVTVTRLGEMSATRQVARAEDDDVTVHAGAKLVDHLLVQLADPSSRRARLALEEDGEEPAIRDRAAAGDRHDARVPPRLHRVGQPVPGDPRLELRELVGRVGAGKHPEDALEGLPGERLERGGAPNGLEQVVHLEPFGQRHRDHLLGEDVERVPRQRRRLDRAVMHALDDHGGLEEVPAVLGEDDALGRLADLVSGTADSLEAAGDRGGALHLDHEVHGAHVDAQLQGAGRDERGETARLQLLLDRDALLPGDAAVMGAYQLFSGQLVEALGEPLRQAPAVDEDDGAAVGPDQLQDPGVDGRPDARLHLAADDGSARPLVLRQHLAQARHVLHGYHDLELQGLAGAGIDDDDVASRSRAAQEPGNGLERSLRGREADALERPCSGARAGHRAEALETLEAEGEVCAPLGPGDRVDLVHDHVLDAPQDLARLAREEQIQALGRGDQDVGRVCDEVPALAGRGVPGPRGDRDVRGLLAQPLGRQRDPCEGRPQVPLHVVRESLERADVQHPDGAPVLPGWSGPRVTDEAVQAPQERGEGLAAAGRRVDQRAAAGADRRPSLCLGLGGRLERRLEPGPHGGPEGRERIGDGHGHGRASIGPRRHVVQMFVLAAHPACRSGKPRHDSGP